MPTKEKFPSSDSQTVPAVSTCQVSLAQSSEPSATAESQHRSRKPTSTDKPPISLNATLIAKSLETLGADSTSSEKVFVPYWNAQCEANVSRLLSATGTDWLVSASNSLNGSLSAPVDKSWFCINWIPVQQRNLSLTSWLSSQFSVPVSTDSEATRTRSKAILLKPTKEQETQLRSWAGSYRWAFNWMVDYLKTTYETTGKSGRYCTAARHALQAAMGWWKEVPAHTLYGAMQDAERAYKLHVKKLTKRQPSSLPRCRKRDQRSFFILGNGVSENGIYPRRLGKLKTAEPLPNRPSDGRIIFEAGRYWLQFPYECETTSSENQGRVAAIDPGIRTFATVYSPEGVGKCGQLSFNRISRLAFSLDDLISRTAKETSSRRKERMKLAQSRLRLRIRNLIDDIHFQVAGWLFKRFDTVIFPEGNFTSAVKRAKRRIRAKSVRSLLNYAFAKFRDRLRWKAELLGKSVVLVSEAYTSKTHNITGEVKAKLGGAKFTESQGVRIDRDLNGALGIFLRALLAQPETSVSATMTANYSMLAESR